MVKHTQMVQYNQLIQHIQMDSDGSTSSFSSLIFSHC